MGKFEGGVTNHSSIRDLLTTPLLDILNFFMGGSDAVDINNLNTQIAFRFPEPDITTYIDERSWHTDGFRHGKSHPFTYVYLSSLYH